jgi:hypothetical protein
MIALLLANNNQTLGELQVILICVAIIVCVGGTLGFLLLRREVPPYWYPRPRRVLKDDREKVKIYRLHKRHPEIFGADPATPHKVIEYPPKKVDTPPQT